MLPILTVDQIVIGKVLNDPSLADQVIPFLTEKHFKESVNRKIFMIMKELYDSGEAPDLAKVISSLEMRGMLDSATSEAISIVVQDITYHDSPVSFYVAQIQARYRKTVEHELLKKAEEKSALGEDVSKLLDALNDNRYQSDIDITSLQEGLNEFQYSLFDGSEQIPSGIGQLDRALSGGFRRGWTYVLGARSGNGKTTFATTLFRNIAANNKQPYFLSMEMKRSDLIGQMMTAETGLSESNLRDPKYIDLYAEGYARISEWKGFIDDGRKVDTIDDIEKLVRYAVQKRNADIIIVDYVQLINIEKQRNRIEEVGYISRRLKKLATAVDRPIICLSQVARNADLRRPLTIKGYTFKAPEMIDLSDSSSLEKDADCIMILSVAEDENGTRPLLMDGQNPAILRIEKNRKGEKGKIIKLAFNGGSASFSARNW